MDNGLHIVIVAAVVTTAIAVGITSAATPQTDILVRPAQKTDRLPSPPAGSDYMTFETRIDRASFLSRVPLD